MATAEELTARIAALETAHASGVRTVSHNGSTVTYASLDELSRAIDRLKGDLAGAQSRRRPKVHYPAFSRGR